MLWHIFRDMLFSRYTQWAGSINSTITLDTGDHYEIIWLENLNKCSQVLLC